MIRSKFIYFVVLFILFLFSILFYDDFAIILFGTVLFFPILLFIYLLCTYKRVSYEILSDNPIASIGDTISYKIVIRNASILPVAFCDLRIQCSNTFHQTKNREQIMVCLSGKQSITLNQGIKAETCGIYKIMLTKTKTYDFIKLFSIKRKHNNTLELTCLPTLTFIEESIISGSAALLDGDDYSKMKKGDDPSEIYNIRSYQDGDSMHRIHWKLSSKTDSIMVKENSYPLYPEVTILILLTKDKSNKKADNLLDLALESLLSLSSYFLDHKIRHTVYWYNEADHMYHSYLVTSLDHIYYILGQLLSTPIYEQKALKPLFHLTYDISITIDQEVVVAWEGCDESK